MRTIALFTAAAMVALAGEGCSGSGSGSSLRCGPGTQELDQLCVPLSSLSCGAGTHVENGACIPDAAPIACGEGTHLSNAACVPDSTLSCGPGTHVEGAVCALDAVPLTCGPETHATGNQCLADLGCGPGTHETEKTCLPDSGLSCGTDTHSESGVCVLDGPAITCGPGTHLVNGDCLPDAFVACGSGTHVAGTLCVVDAAPLSCGPGTHEVGSRCQPDVACGPGTHASDHLCVPDSSLTCGAGTHAQGGACVRDVPSVTCATGSHPEAGSCVPDSLLSCGAGTHVAGSLCVLDSAPLTCGAGTQAIGSECQPDGSYYDLQVLLSDIPADGYDKIPVLAIGRRADGSPATDQVRVVASRPSAGSFDPDTFALGALGSTTYFKPCSSASQGCLGAVRFSLVLASDPSIVLATTPELELVEPVGVGTPAPCLVGGNVFFLMHDVVYPHGVLETRYGDFSSRTFPTGSSDPTYVSIEVDPYVVTGDGLWLATFQAPFDGSTLHVGIYENATEMGTAVAPGVHVQPTQSECPQRSARFQIHELEMSAGQVRRFTATFYEFCGGNGPAANKPQAGCIHYEAH